MLAGACSVNQATSNAGNMDEPARRACADLQAVIQAKASGAVDAASLLGELTQVASEASTSANPIFRARAIAVLSDASQIASGGEGRSLDADLASLNQLCSTP